ncbi:MAG: AAA family ATPase [Deltaproteobacteria bacterium]|nr:AAA family ATPase [Deltaproteobacteria bacterium]
MTPADTKPIIAVCGKGGVGKTAASALLARAFLDSGVRPVLLVDADPAGGLLSAVGESVVHTLSQARAKLVAAARGAGEETKKDLARQLDYMVMEALAERDGYSLLAMGKNEDRGCFCPANSLLREAIDVLIGPFSLMLIDAEAGLEQISRQVTRRVTRVVAVHDGSARSADTVGHILSMAGPERLCVMGNRGAGPENLSLPDGVPWLGSLPEDPDVAAYDRERKSLWDLPPDNPARAEALRVADRLLREGADQAG